VRTLDSSHAQPGDIVRFVPVHRQRQVTLLVEAVDWHPQGFTVLTGRRARLVGNELDGYEMATRGQLLSYAAPSTIEWAPFPGDDQ
jgi:hypothetical protein